MGFENNFFPPKENKTDRAGQKQSKRPGNELEIER
jgi:hypothetical protein